MVERPVLIVLYHAPTEGMALMSGSAHALPVYVFMRSESVDDDRSPTGHLLRESPRPPQEVYMGVGMALKARAAAFGRRLSYYGWDDTNWLQCRRRVVNVLNASIA